MIGFSQTNDLSGMFTSNVKPRSMTNSSNQTSSTNDFCDEIDEIMKHEHEDVISLDDSLSTTQLDLDLDSISDLLENPRSSSSTTTTSSFNQSLNINDLSPTINNTNNNSQSSTTTSAYSSLGVSPKFTILSLNNNHFQQFIQSNNSHLPPYVQQQDNSVLGALRPFELQSNIHGPLDVKRFRSASMNDGPSLQQEQNKLDPRFVDPYRFKSSTYINPSSYQDKPTSPVDTPSNPTWPFASCPRPTSNSFSEVENQQQQLRLHPQLTSILTGSPTIHYRNPARFSNNINFPQQTLYSINQSTNENSTPPTKTRISLADFPVEEIKDDPSSPSCTIEQQSEPDLWSDIEQNSSDRIQDNDNTSNDNDDDDDETNTSMDYAKVFETGSSPPRFWKYNVQSKGPKTKRMLYLKERDPHLYREFSDPIYQIKLTQTNGHRFNKLRKGDGNDVTPNPTKLYQLGKQIRDLLKNSSSVYQGIYNVEHHTNTNDSIEAKKEKNKLASKTCRLRKKAQHEANKLKLQGLNEEHKSLIDIIASIKLTILKRYHDDQLGSNSSPINRSFEAALDQLIADKYSQPVAGNADGYVEAKINAMECLYSQTST